MKCEDDARRFKNINDDITSRIVIRYLFSERER